MAKTTKRNPSISLIRMLCTGMVVLVHISQQLESVLSQMRYATDWLNLGLVMFFCISAFLYSGREITSVGKWYVHRFVEILVPSLLVGLGTLAVFALRGGLTAAQVWATVLSCLGLQAYIQDSWMFIQLWFLSYILFFYLTVPLLQKIPCKTLPAWKFWGLLVLLFLVMQALGMAVESLTGITLLSAAMLMRLYLPYFVLRRYDINGREIKPVMWGLTGAAVLAVALVCPVRYGGFFDLPGVVAELLFIHTQTLAGFVLFYWLYRGLSRVKKYGLLLKLSDRFSYEIYLTHCLFIGYSTSVLNWFDSKLLGIALALVFTAAASVAVHYLAKGIKGIPRLFQKRESVRN